MAQVDLRIAVTLWGLMADDPSKSPVLAAWTQLDDVIARVAKRGVILETFRGRMTRQTCVDNAEILLPVIQELGNLLAYSNETRMLQHCIP